MRLMSGISLRETDQDEAGTPPHATRVQRCSTAQPIGEAVSKLSQTVREIAATPGFPIAAVTGDDSFSCK